MLDPMIAEVEYSDGERGRCRRVVGVAGRWGGGDIVSGEGGSMDGDGDGMRRWWWVVGGLKKGVSGD